MRLPDWLRVELQLLHIETSQRRWFGKLGRTLSPLKVLKGCKPSTDWRAHTSKLSQDPTGEAGNGCCGERHQENKAVTVTNGLKDLDQLQFLLRNVH